MLQRCSRPLCSSQITGGSPIWVSLACLQAHDGRGQVVRGDGGPEKSITRSLRTQQCAWRAPALSARGSTLPRPPPLKAESGIAVLTSSLIGSRPNSRRSTSEQCECAERMSADTHALDSLRLPVMLLRKEVIQPHLPVRLPCYDFVPIARPTFDSSLRKRLGHWLRVLPTFVT